MLDIKRIRKDPEGIKERLGRRGERGGIDVLLRLDRERRALITESEKLKSERNEASAQIADELREGKDPGEMIARQKELSVRIKEIDRKVGDVDEEFARIMDNIPNIPHDSVPDGRSSNNNRLVKEIKDFPDFGFNALPHWELGENLGIIDFSSAARMTGSHFPLYKSEGAMLERALYSFMLDLHTRKHGYREVIPPYMVNRSSMRGTGQLPRLEGDMYRCEIDDYFLIPTAEVPLVNMHRESVLSDAELPIRYVSYTPCFRREAGSYGRETRGLIRVHQFDKVELVAFSRPDDSYNELERMLGHAEEVVRGLGLPYRVLELCAGEISFASSKTYDVEIWAPGIERWLEVASISNCEDFQSRRASIRCKKRGERGTFYPHTLNASGVALARTYIGVLENYQQADGTVRIPEALVPYMGGKTELR